MLFAKKKKENEFRVEKIYNIKNKSLENRIC
jgi:hypothetical protein